MKDWQGREVTEQESPDDLIPVWRIEPAITGDFDHYLERGYQRAVKLAQRVVAHLMDNSDADPDVDEDVLIPLPITIKIDLVRMSLGDYLEIVGAD